jgi:hypothetical protein
MGGLLLKKQALSETDSMVGFRPFAEMARMSLSPTDSTAFGPVLPTADFAEIHC